MKKILKVIIKKTRTEDSCLFEYPEQWDSKKIHVLVYEDNPDNLGKVEECCLCVTDKEMAIELLKNSRVKEISKDEANLLGRKWRPSIARITDESRVVQFGKKLLSKPSLRQTLRQYFSQEELDSVNETKAAPGIEKGQEFNIEKFI